MGTLKTIFLTGGTGFIGSHLARRLCELNYELVCLVRKTSNITILRSLPNTRIVYGDLRNIDRIGKALTGADIVIHAGAVLHGGRYSAEDFYEINYKATVDLARLVLKNRIKKFLFISSISAVGPRKNTSVLDESAEYKPVDAYGNSKMLAEKVLLEMWHKQNFPVIIIRPSFIYGPGDRHGIFRYCNLVKIGLFPLIGEDGPLRSICFISDLVEGIIRVLESGEPGKIYTFCDDSLYTVRKVVETMAKWKNGSFVVISVPAKVRYFLEATATLVKTVFPCFPVSAAAIREFSIHNYVFDNSHTKQRLNWKPRVGLKQGLKETWQWYTQLSGRFRL